MAVEIKVPTLGESVVEATISRWLKPEGASITAGEPLVELETDKVNVEVPADSDGVLEQISRKEGETVGIGDVLGLLGSAGNGAAPTPAPSTVAETASAAPAVPVTNGTTDTPTTDSFVTPVARKMAADYQVDLKQVSGSGPHGRIRQEDVEAYVQQRDTAKPSVVPATEAAKPVVVLTETAKPHPAALPILSAVATDAQGRRETRSKMSRLRQTVAARLKEAQNTACILTTFNEIDMTAVMQLRKERNEAFEKRNGVKLGFMSFFTKAAVGALKAFPLVNAEIQGDEIVEKHYYDIGIAVSTEKGLMVPVVRNADQLNFAQIEKEIAALATKAREGKIGLAELQGGTFSITNGGVFGSLMSTPILNTPQSGILGLHKIEERPVVRNGEIVIRPMMYVALSYDHRIVDGRESVQFLVRIKEMIEDPLTLLVEG